MSTPTMASSRRPSASGARVPVSISGLRGLLQCLTPSKALQLAVLTGVLLSAVWALVSPLGTVPDEPAHVAYAAAAVQGQAPEAGESVLLPPAIADPGTSCLWRRPSVTADCIPPLSDSGDLVPVRTAAADYPVLYYLLVGWPTLFGFGETTWYVMRLLSVAVGGALLWVGALAWREPPPVVVAAVVVAVTPTTSFLLGAVNPNGAEIVAGVALVLAGTGVARQAVRGQPRRRAMTASAVCFAYLAMARPSSYVLAAALAGVLVLAALPEVLRHVQARPRLTAAGVVALGVLFVLAMLEQSARPTLHGGTSELSVLGAAALILSGFDELMLDTGGAFGWYDHRPPLPLVLLPLVLMGSFVLLGWVTARWLHERTALVLLAAGALFVGPFFAVLTVFLSGSGYSARYAMALTQALPVLGAAVAQRPSRDGLAAVVDRALLLVPYLVVGLHLLDAAGSWLRYALGLPMPVGVRMLSAVTWVPPLWPLVLLLALASVAVAHRLQVRLRGDMEIAVGGPRGADHGVPGPRAAGPAQVPRLTGCSSPAPPMAP